MPNRVYSGDGGAFRRGARASLVNMPSVGEVLSRGGGGGEKSGSAHGGLGC